MGRTAGVVAIGKVPMATRIFCPNCKHHQPLKIGDMQPAERLPDQIWGDLVCSVCFTIITSLLVDEPGVYDFIKVHELDKTPDGS